MPVAPLLATPVLAKTMRKSPKRWTIQSFVDFFHRFATWGSMVWYGNCMEHDQSFVYIYGHWCLWMVYPNSAIWRWIVASWRSQDANFRDIFWSPKKHKKIHVCDIFLKKSYFINRYLVILVSSTRFSVEFPWDGLGKCSTWKTLRFLHFGIKVETFWSLSCTASSRASGIAQWGYPSFGDWQWHTTWHTTNAQPQSETLGRITIWIVGRGWRSWRRNTRLDAAVRCFDLAQGWGTWLKTVEKTDWHRFCKEMSRMSCPNINRYIYIIIYLHITLDVRSWYCWSYVVP